MMQSVVAAALTAGVTAIVQLMIWLSIRRAIERSDTEIGKLQDQVHSLTETRIKRIEQDVKAVEETQKEDASSRGQMHREIEGVRREFMGQVVDARVQIEKATTEVQRCVGWLHDQQEAMINAGKDVAVLLERTDELKRFLLQK